LLEHRGDLYLFTSDGTPRPRATSTGVQVWTSPNGIQWDRVGEIAGASITAITATGGQLVALGADPHDGSPHIWTSVDGAAWTSSRLPVQNDSGVPTSARLTDAIWHDDHLYVAGSIIPDPQRAIIDRLPPDVAAHVDRYGMSLSNGPDGPSIDIYAPLGVIGYSASVESLGVDDGLADALFRDSPGEDLHIWRSRDGADWVTLGDDSPYLEQLWSGPDGELLASGWDDFGPATWSSPDGVAWDRVDRAMVRVVRSSNDRLIGVRNEIDLVRSEDGRSWESLGTEVVLPQSVQWHLDEVEASPTAIAAIATAWIPHRGAPASTPPWTFDVSGNTITVDYNTGQLTVEGPEGSTIVPMWTNDVHDRVTADFEREMLTFRDPEHDVELVAVGFDVLREAEASFYAGRDFGQRALLMSRPDGNWAILNLAEEIGDREHVVMLRLFGDRMILVTFPIPSWFAGSPPDWAMKVAKLP